MYIYGNLNTGENANLVQTKDSTYGQYLLFHMHLPTLCQPLKIQAKEGKQMVYESDSTQLSTTRLEYNI